MRTGATRGQGVVTVVLLIASVWFAPTKLQGQASMDRLPWTIPPEPLVEIGGADPESTFTRIVGAVRLSTGQIAVAEGQAQEIRIYSSSGVHQRTIGRSGEGPGEFRGLASLALGSADTLFAFDMALQRLTAFTPDGQVARTQRVNGAPGPLAVVLPSLDGTWYGIENDMVLNVGPGTIGRDTVSVGVLSPDLNWQATLRQMPGRMTAAFVTMGRAAVRAPAFTPHVMLRQSGRCTYVISNQERQIHTLSGGRLTSRSLSLPIQPRPISQTDIEAWANHELRNVPAEAREIGRAALLSIPRVSVMPLFADARMDSSGLIWLQEYRVPESEGRRWFVLTQAGQFLGYVDTPAPLRLLAIAENSILGVAMTPLGEEILREYRLSRNQSPSAASGETCQR